MSAKTQRDAYRKLTQAELNDEAKRLFGDDPLTYAFRCPTCGDVATVKDFVDAGAGERAGQECIGRSLGALDAILQKYKGRGCDWVAYGLFRGPWEIVLPAEGDKPERTAWSFALADPPKKSAPKKKAVEKPVLAPTKTRLRLMQDIADEKVVEYTTETPALIFSPTEDRAVTARVEELAAAKLVTRDTPVHQTYFKIPALTDAGREWLDTHGKSE